MATKLTIYTRSGRQVTLPLQHNNETPERYALALTEKINAMKSKNSEMALRFQSMVFMAENIEFIDVE